MIQQYKDAIENSNIVSKTDIDGIITFVNEEFCNCFEYSKDELIGKNHNIIRHPDVPTIIFKKLWQTIKNKQTYKNTVKNLSKSGRVVYLNTTVTPILDENNDIQEFIAIRYEVTKEVELKKELENKYRELDFLNSTLEYRVQQQTKELKKLNESLEIRVQKEIDKNEENQKVLFWQSRMASLGQMLENIAHQWRQPLFELSLCLFNIKESVNNNNINKFTNYYKESNQVIQNMSKTIEDFSNFFNPNKEKKTFLIQDSVTNALNIMKKTINKEKINIRINIIELYASGVINELSQVLINLIKNSLDAFKSNNISNPLIIIKVFELSIKNKIFVCIKITDNAGGIKEKFQEKIFDPYFTTKHNSLGTGLGLFMSKMIIEQSLDGKIEVCQEPLGTSMIITLPKSHDD